MTPVDVGTHADVAVLSNHGTHVASFPMAPGTDVRQTWSKFAHGPVSALWIAERFCQLKDCTTS